MTTAIIIKYKIVAAPSCLLFIGNFIISYAYLPGFGVGVGVGVGVGTGVGFGDGVGVRNGVGVGMTVGVGRGVAVGVGVGSGVAVGAGVGVGAGSTAEITPLRGEINSETWSRTLAESL
jgi:hypothetical protein